jgi:3-hydroxyacyl-[acyl-carrier-protein] dehydratase
MAEGLTHQQVRTILPHRYPFLLVDRVLAVTAEHAVGIKNVSANEPFFQGHFPAYPVMPGVLIVEALAQLGATIVLHHPEFQGKLALLAGLDGWRFRRQVTPGDTLRLEVTLTTLRSRFGKAHAQATVDGELAAEGDLLFGIASSEEAGG